MASSSRRTTAEQPGERTLVTSRSFRKSLRRGTTIVLLVADNAVSRLAFRMARALLQPRDRLELVTVVLAEDSVAYGQALLAPYLAEPCANVVLPVVLVKGEERLAEVITAYVSSASCSADLVVAGSQTLALSGSRAEPLPAAGSMALRLAKALRCCPLLVVKANSKGPFLRSDNPSMGLKVMVDCQSTSRHLVTWLMDSLDAEKDALFLAVSSAHDQGTGQLRETASRMLTAFSVQAGVHEFYAAQRVFKETGAKALPQAVEADAIDILAVTAPECKLLPPAITDLLASARCSVLLHHAKGGTEPLALGAPASAVSAAFLDVPAGGSAAITG